MPLNEGFIHSEKVGGRAHGLSVLAYLTVAFRHSSEEEWRRRLAQKRVHLDEVAATGEEILRAGQQLSWHRPPWFEADAPHDLAILYQDEFMLAVFKPSGLPTLPGGDFLKNTLLAVVRRHFPEANPLHRLGRATSGLVLFARTQLAASLLAKAWREHEVEKTYRALGRGVASQDVYDIATPIGPVPHPKLGFVHAASAEGKASFSTARVLERRATETLFQVDIRTGRPHQVRIHLAAIGHPLVGDPLYIANGVVQPLSPGLPGDGGYLLHAERLTFRHPISGAPLSICSPAPATLMQRKEPEKRDHE